MKLSQESDLELLGGFLLAGLLRRLDRTALIHLLEKAVAGEITHAFRWRFASLGHGGMEAGQAQTGDGAFSFGGPRRKRWCDQEAEGHADQRKAADHWVQEAWVIWSSRFMTFSRRREL